MDEVRTAPPTPFRGAPDAQQEVVSAKRFYWLTCPFKACHQVTNGADESVVPDNDSKDTDRCIDEITSPDQAP